MHFPTGPDGAHGDRSGAGRVSLVKPSDGKEGVTKFVLETIKMAGPNACPPLVVGVAVTLALAPNRHRMVEVWRRIVVVPVAGSEWDEVAPGSWWPTLRGPR